MNFCMVQWLEHFTANLQFWVRVKLMPVFVGVAPQQYVTGVASAPAK